MGSEPTHMLDTNVIIAIRRSRPEAVVARLGGMSVGSVVMSTVTFGELSFGVAKSAAPDAGRSVLERLARDIPVLDLGPTQAIHYGDIRAVLAAKGMMIGANDLWIAAHARSLGLALVTGNVGEFGRVPGLVVENWLA